MPLWTLLRLSSPARYRKWRSTARLCEGRDEWSGVRKQSSWRVTRIQRLGPAGPRDERRCKGWPSALEHSSAMYHRSAE